VGVEMCIRDSGRRPLRRGSDGERELWARSVVGDEAELEQLVGIRKRARKGGASGVNCGRRSERTK